MISLSPILSFRTEEEGDNCVEVFNFFDNEWRDRVGTFGELRSQEETPPHTQFLGSRTVGQYLSGSDGFISHFNKVDKTVGRNNELQRAAKRNNIQDWLEKYSQEHQNVYWC